MRRAAEVWEELGHFDRQLADVMRPFTDLRELSEGKGNLYGPVLDKFAAGRQSRGDAEELRAAVDRLQLQLKAQLEALGQLEAKAEAVPEPLLGALLAESVRLKKVNLLGCKMKIYQERLKDLR